MSISRREALARLAALSALPLLDSPRSAADPLDGSIAEYQAGRRRREWTAVEVTQRALERCRGVGARLRAVDVLSAQSALAEARASDERLRAGTSRGPMDGVPVFAKAIYDVNGLPTTGSNADWAARFADPVRRDAIEVARLRKAGAVILGKTAADDFAYHGNGTSSHTGQVLNPHDPTDTLTPGGSSAGSAAAVATGMAFVALGTDDGGSNRIPAQFSGVVGMKPTFGLVPRTAVIPTWPYLDTHGPLARSVADAALMLAVIAGADASDPLALAAAFDPRPLAPLHEDSLKDVRLGIVELHAPRAQMTAAAVGTWDRALGDLRAAGAVVEPFDAAVTRANYTNLFTESARARGDLAPNPKAPAPTANALFHYFLGRARDASDARDMIRRGYAAYRSFYDVLPETFEECEPLFDQPMERDGAGVSFAKSRAEVVAKLAASMKAANVEAMVYPTMPFRAPRAADSWPDVRTPLGYGNWLGLPEVSVPAGLGSDGVPELNLSVVGLPGTDARVLAIAYAYERASRRFVLAR